MKKITLKNLHEATAQEVFDQCAVHLLTQKIQCSEFNMCRYKMGNLSCAAGCFIDENEYNKNYEGKSWTTLISDFDVSPNHKELIQLLQDIHDGRKPNIWKEKLFEAAKDFNLNTNAINNLN